MPGRAQVGDQCAHLAKGRAQRVEIGQLAANMHRHALHPQARQRCRQPIGVKRAVIGHAELVFLAAGRNLGMGARDHIRVDAEGDRRNLAQLARHRREHFGFRLGFDVELENTLVQRQAHFIGGFADAGKHDTIRRNSRRTGAQQFARRHDIRAIALPRQRRQHRPVRVRLDGKGDQRVARGCQCLAEDLSMALNRRGGIDIDGGTHLRGNRLQRDAFGVQHAVNQFEMVHGFSFSPSKSNGSISARAVG